MWNYFNFTPRVLWLPSPQLLFFLAPGRLLPRPPCPLRLRLLAAPTGRQLVPLPPKSFAIRGTLVVVLRSFSGAGSVTRVIIRGAPAFIVARLRMVPLAAHLNMSHRLSALGRL